MRRAPILLYLAVLALFAAAAVGSAQQASIPEVSSTSGLEFALGTSGPDAFGYTWNDTVSFAWIDARVGGTELTARGDDAFQQVSIGFDFRFYENSYTQCYVSTNGLLTFGGPNTAPHNTALPSPLAPGNLIAPFWDDLCIEDTEQTRARIYCRMEGAYPNRHFVVQWRDALRCGSVDPLTFEAVLYENGDILFQYLNLNGSLTECTAGIQNAAGHDGLQYVYKAPGLSSGKAIRFTRPSSQARVGIYPLSQGQLGSSDQVLSYTLQIQNLGELGADTMDLVSTSAWPMRLCDASGTSLLRDTDADGYVDTGRLNRGAVLTVTVQVTVPGTASVGDWSRAAITATSSSDPTRRSVAWIASAVPPSFAQSYTEGWDPFGALDGEVYLQTSYAGAMGTEQVTWDHAEESTAAITRAPDGRLTCAWAKSYWHLRGFPTSEIEYATIAPAGAGVSLSKLTMQDRTPFPILDISPTLAVASNGNIALAWTRQYPHWQPVTESCAVENVAYAVLSGSGQMVKSPSVLTGNAEEYCLRQPRAGTARDLAPVVAATDDDRYFVAWQRETFDGTLHHDVYYAVLDVNGNTLLSPTGLVTNTTGSAGHLNPRLLGLAGARMLVLWDDTHNLSFAVLSSAGAVVRGPEALNTGGSNNGRADAAISSNGDVLIAWIQDNMVAYTILNAALQSVRPATRLNDPLSQASDAVSAAITAQGQWVLTWHDDAGSALHYALLASDGQILTPPMPFHQAHEDWIAVNRQGYGLAPTDFTYVAPAPTPTPAGLAPRTVLAELFSISVESLCAGPQGALSRLVDAYGPSQLAALQYFPSSDDLGSPAADLRAYLYRVFRSPLSVWDGAQILSTGSADPNDVRIQKQYRGIIEFERAQPSRLTLSLEASFTQNRTAIRWTAMVHPLTDAIGSNLLFDCFVYEDPVTYVLQDRTASARFVVRDLPLERLLNLTTQEAQVITGTANLQPGWTRDHLGLIALVQNRTSYQVLQAAVKPMVAQATPTPTPVGASRVVTLQQGLNGYTGTSDTYISSSEPNRNFENPAAPPRLQVKGDGSLAPLIRFDLPEELRDRTIVSATLQLLTRYRANPMSCTVGAYRVRRAWLADQATWINATRAQAWGFPGVWPVDCDPTPMDEVQLSSDNAWYDLDVTQAVREWTTDSVSNHGLLLRSTIVNAATYQFSSSEDNVQAFHPRLVIVWGEPEVTPQATATPSKPTPTSTPSIVETTLQQGLNAYTGTSDTYISSSESNRNFESPPGPPRLQVKGDGSLATLIRFDLPEELRDHTIVSATLQLLTRYRANPMSCTVGAYRVRRAWLADQATWLDASHTQAWSYPGAWPVDCDPLPLHEVQLSSDDAWYGLDVTQAVREWTADRETNYGLLLRSASANAATYQFASSEDNVTMFHPKLVIVYDRSMGTPVPTTTPTATSTPTRTRTPTPTQGPTRTQTPLPLQWTLQQGRAGYAGTQDTYVAAAGPDTNYSHEQRLLVKGDGLVGPLIRFELPPDLRGYAIIDATLELFARGRDKVVPCMVGVYRMRRTWQAGEATWLRATSREGWNRPGLGPGTDYDSASLDEVQLSSANDWYAWHITQVVRDWIADPSSNYGLCLRSGSSGAVTYELASSEHYQQDSRPRLVILYGEPTATPTATVTSTPMPTATQTPSPTTTPSPSPSATQRPSPTVTATASPTTTQAASPSPSATPEATATPAPSRTPTRTPTTASWIVHLPIVIKEHSLGSQPDAWRRVGAHFWTLR